jgi:hypothetical protein
MISICLDPSSISHNTPLGSRALFSNDPIIVAMSCFGEGTCPSFFHANGTPIDLTGSLPRPPGESAVGKPGSKGKQTVSNAAWTLAVRRVRFDEAIGDLRKVLMEKKARSISTSIARGLGCTVFSGKQFAVIFESLGELAGAMEGSSDLRVAIEGNSLGGTRDNTDVLNPSGRRVKRVKV